MKTYELVCVIDAGLSSSDVSVLRKKIEKLISIKEVDEIGLLPLAYSLKNQMQAYFYSYHVEMNNDDLLAAKVEMALMKGLEKFVFYKMRESDKFMKFAELKKRFDEMVEIDENEKLSSVEEVEGKE